MLNENSFNTEGAYPDAGKQRSVVWGPNGAELRRSENWPKNCHADDFVHRQKAAEPSNGGVLKANLKWIRLKSPMLMTADLSGAQDHSQTQSLCADASNEESQNCAIAATACPRENKVDMAEQLENQKGWAMFYQFGF